MSGHMVVTLAPAALAKRDLSALLARFGLLVAVNLGFLALLLIAFFGTSGPALWRGATVSLLVYAVMNAVLLRGLVVHYPHQRLGLCNIVTHFRATMMAGLAAGLPNVPLIAANPVLAWSMVALATIALACDGIDGWAARRSGLVSRFGARFDMEVDSLLALILAVIVWQLDVLGAWVLLLGVMRYLYGAAAWVAPWLNGPVPARFSGKLVCVIQIAVLIALIAPVITGGVALILGLGALALVVWTFAVDIIYLWQRRNA
jgi:phosphatidylglycerophosphate synthase